jgi:hypothetical protein
VSAASSPDETAIPPPGDDTATADGEAAKRPGWFKRNRRRIAVWTLVVLSALLVLVGSLTIWVKRQMLEPDAWANASAELIQDEDIQQALAARMADALIERADIQGRLEERLPPVAQPLAAPIAGFINQAAEPAALRLVQGPRVQALFEGIVRDASTQLIAVLEGNEGGRITTTGGQVVLDLSPLVNQLAARLGVETAPDAGQIVLMESDQLEAAQKAVRIIKVMTVFLILVVLALLALALYLARGYRREVLRGIGASFIIVGLLLLVVRRLAGNAIVEALSSGTSEEAVKSTWLIVTSLLQDMAIGLIVYGVIAVVGAWLAGRTRWAVGIRRALAPTCRHRPVLLYGGVFLLILLGLLFGPAGESRRWIGTLILAALIFFGVELLRRQTLREFPDTVPEEPGPGTPQSPPAVAA